ncbi:MAG: monomethylamine:corrinoid methyltransferase [Bryobacterales bacterium]|nr:monomethylamine:corrinoid methyltransferase [Bryobacterales bacterium]
MIPVIEFQRRASHGPVTTVDDFDLDLAFKVRDLVAEYGIRYDPEQLLVDDRTADAIFEAAVKHLSSVGLYFMSTGRVIQYDEQEIRQLATESQQNPACVNLGKGVERMQLRYRRGADEWAPLNYGGPTGVGFLDSFVAYAQSYAQEPSVRGFGIVPGLAKLGNLDPKAGQLSEVTVALWEQEALREALKRTGRLDMNLGLLCTASTPSGTMAVMASGLRDSFNTQIGIHIMPEQKLDWSRLLLAQYCEITGIEPWQSSMSCVGGLCRNAAESAVLMVANALAQLSYAHGGSMSFFASHLDGTWATRPTEWAMTGALRAAERHLGLATSNGGLCGIVDAWRTPLTLWQAAAQVPLYVASGMSYAWVTGHTGLESRLIDQMMRACVGMSHEAANELCQKIMRKVDGLLPHVRITNQEQVRFADAYDLKTVRPKPRYEAGMMNVMDELANLGMPL